MPAFRKARVKPQETSGGRRRRKQAAASCCFLWILVVGSTAVPLALQAHTPPSIDSEATYRRLEQQDAEIQWLRSRISELTELTTAPATQAPAPQAPALQRLPIPSQFTSSAASEIDALKGRLAAVEELQAAAKSDKPPGDGWVDVSNEKWTVKLGGHVQMDYVTWANADPAIADSQNYFNFRRLRLVADGTGYAQFDFRLQMTLEPGQGSNTSPFGSPDVKDAYLSMNEIPWIGRFRIGNFFVPFSLEQVTNDTNNMFLERSIPTQGIFAADREVGMAIYNCTDDQNISWSGGLFFDDINDTIKTRFDDNQGYRLSGRLVWLPYYDESSDGRFLLHTAIGVLHTDDQDNSVRFRARPQVQRGPLLIDSGNLPADSYTTGNLELAVVWGRVTVQHEAFLSNVNMLSGPSVHVGGAYAHVSYFLTGENRIYERFGQHGAQFVRNKPYTNFFAVPGYTGWGAWEAKARWSYLDLTETNRGQYNDLTVGFNWYWSDRTRIMFDWIHPLTSSGTVFGSTESDLIAMRFDVNW